MKRIRTALVVSGISLGALIAPAVAANIASGDDPANWYTVTTTFCGTTYRIDQNYSWLDDAVQSFGANVRQASKGSSVVHEVTIVRRNDNHTLGLQGWGC